MGKRIDLQPGEKRGLLTFVKEVEPRSTPSGRKIRFAHFDCACGNSTVCALGAWREGNTRSCGCLRTQATASTTHGQSRHGEVSPLYRAWAGMRSRCASPSQYVGVGFDHRWATFEGFRDNQPAGRPFEPGLHLARFGDTGDYSPDNCRWATASENAREARERTMLRLPDGRFALDVARQSGIGDRTFRTRLRRGWNLTDAATRPVRS